jgi:predicted TIM-barrel fold metal-dependent hydrolase
MHIIDPSTFSLSAQAVYRLERHYSLDDALSFESSLGIRNIVLVQPSIYGHDNACLLDALRRLAGLGSARGVVSFDPADTPPLATLRRWHALGVRGVRVNVQSHGVCIDPGKLASDLRRYADAIRPLGKWVLQLYVPMSLMQGLEDIIPRLGVRVCIDHLGYPDLTATRRSPLDLHCLLPGFQSLLALLQSGETFVKLSAPYRIVNSFDEDSYLEAITKELLQVRGASRVVFGTDWPHTRFEGLDIRPWIERVLDWCDGNENTVERVFKRNAEELWDVPQAKSMHS